MFVQLAERDTYKFIRAVETKIICCCCLKKTEQKHGSLTA